MIKTIIVAKAANQVIGNGDQLSWHLPADMRHFRRTTLGHHVIMGRITYESLARPLLGRKIIVLSRNVYYKAPGCYTATDLQKAADLAERAGETEVFVAGGGATYQAAIAWVDKICLTEVKAEVAGDTFFPALSKYEWIETKRISHQPDAQHRYAYDFVELIRTR
ncbi:MAG: dihydrofolate reductase [Bacteroidota bacterium]